MRTLAYKILDDLAPKGCYEGRNRFFFTYNLV